MLAPFAVLNRAIADFRLKLKPSLLANYNFMDTGKTSISVKYQNGTDRNTLEKLNQYLVTLNVKYLGASRLQFFCTMQAPPRERSSSQSLPASSRLSAPICTM